MGSSTQNVWEFHWTACPGAESYHLWVLRAGDRLPEIDDRSLQTTRYRDEHSGVVGDAYRRSWPWKVRSKQHGQWNPWSEVRAFDLEPSDMNCGIRGGT